MREVINSLNGAAATRGYYRGNQASDVQCPPSSLRYLCDWIFFVLVTFFLVSFPGCTTSCGHHARDTTAAHLFLMGDSLRLIAYEAPRDFDPQCFGQLAAYLEQHGHSTAWPLGSARVDAWKRPFKLFVSQDGSAPAYLVLSAGEDGIFGTDDDLRLLVDFEAERMKYAGRR